MAWAERQLSSRPRPTTAGGPGPRRHPAPRRGPRTLLEVTDLSTVHQLAGHTRPDLGRARGSSASASSAGRHLEPSQTGSALPRARVVDQTAPALNWLQLART